MSDTDRHCVLKALHRMHVRQGLRLAECPLCTRVETTAAVVDTAAYIAAWRGMLAGLRTTLARVKGDNDNGG